MSTRSVELLRACIELEYEVKHMINFKEGFSYKECYLQSGISEEKSKTSWDLNPVPSTF